MFPEELPFVFLFSVDPSAEQGRGRGHRAGEDTRARVSKKMGAESPPFVYQ